jgi:hypothetical protein
LTGKAAKQIKNLCNGNGNGTPGLQVDRRVLVISHPGNGLEPQRIQLLAPQRMTIALHLAMMPLRTGRAAIEPLRVVIERLQAGVVQAVACRDRPGHGFCGQ